MKITNYFNANKEDVKKRKFNILFGISLGNKYFSKENIKQYVAWCIENTKEKVVILIPDKIHAINYEIKNEYSKLRASHVSRRKGLEIEATIKDILDDFSELQQKKITILHWEDIENLEYQLQKIQILKEFEQNNVFKKEIVDIVRENINGKVLNEHGLEKLSEYILKELPILISGTEYEGCRFELLLYPGLSKIDSLVFELQENKRFHELVSRLNIKHKLKIIEAYVD